MRNRGKGLWAVDPCLYDLSLKVLSLNITQACVSKKENTKIVFLWHSRPWRRKGEKKGKF